MKILIRGAGFQNKGAEAMLLVVQRELSSRLPEASFYATVSTPESPIAFTFGLSPVLPKRRTVAKVFRAVPIVSKIYEMLISYRNQDVARATKTSKKTAFEIYDIGRVDGVVDISGFSYSDSWGSAPLKDTYAWVEHCDLKGVPYIFMPQAWGSFDEKEIAFWAKKVCEKANLLFSRDDVSSTYLSHLQNVAPEKIRRAPDIAYRFKGAPEAVAISFFRDLGFNSRPVIAIVPNMRVYEKTTGVGPANQYINLLTAIANHCINNLGANVLLAPNEIRVASSSYPDDRFLCGIIESCIQNPEYCFTIRDCFSSQHIKSVLGQVDLLIASRFHSLVFALTQSVPVLALGWSHKYLELLKPFKMEKYILDHDQLTIDSAISLLEDSWRLKNENSQKISSTIPLLQLQVDELFDEVAKLIKEAKQ